MLWRQLDREWSASLFLLQLSWIYRLSLSVWAQLFVCKTCWEQLPLVFLWYIVICSFSVTWACLEALMVWITVAEQVGISTNDLHFTQLRANTDWILQRPLEKCSRAVNDLQKALLIVFQLTDSRRWWKKMNHTRVCRPQPFLLSREGASREDSEEDSWFLIRKWNCVINTSCDFVSLCQYYSSLGSALSGLSFLLTILRIDENNLL